MASAALLRFLPRHAERVSASYFLSFVEIKTLKQVQGDAVFYPIVALTTATQSSRPIRP
jgi:hypothetical protein